MMVGDGCANVLHLGFRGHRRFERSRVAADAAVDAEVSRLSQRRLSASPWRQPDSSRNMTSGANGE
jgi:hypothetical protein